MPYGFFTIEQWKPRSRGKKPQWIPVAHLDACHNLAAALDAIEQRGKPGFFRVIQTQRAVWSEKIDGKLRIRKWHAGSPNSLARGARASVRDKGRYPVKSR